MDASPDSSPDSSGFRANLSELRSLDLIAYPDGATATVTDLLFPPGLS